MHLQITSVQHWHCLGIRPQEGAAIALLECSRHDITFALPTWKTYTKP